VCGRTACTDRWGAGGNRHQSASPGGARRLSPTQPSSSGRRRASSASEELAAASKQSQGSKRKRRSSPSTLLLGTNLSSGKTLDGPVLQSADGELSIAQIRARETCPLGTIAGTKRPLNTVVPRRPPIVPDRKAARRPRTLSLLSVQLLARDPAEQASASWSAPPSRLVGVAPSPEIPGSPRRASRVGALSVRSEEPEVIFDVVA
jgi:hypothetical protein